ncbi:hypothetical protein [Carboxylicivirga sp. N1Y90]|uniref:hypothetical protein n=1 Tax=Carboxylicivirga fragile TaxID=3417571 RepID=UPI003D325CEE|nr:hypothetical protein [Marinilabiliaceae bacterium N1Y90]
MSEPADPKSKVKKRRIRRKKAHACLELDRGYKQVMMEYRYELVKGITLFVLVTIAIIWMVLIGF